MTITASQLTSSKTLDEFRQEFNKLVTDVTDIKNNSPFGSTILFEGSSDEKVRAPKSQTFFTIEGQLGMLKKQHQNIKKQEKSKLKKTPIS